jgi:hypothetical protein
VALDEAVENATTIGSRRYAEEGDPAWRAPFRLTSGWNHEHVVSMAPTATTRPADLTSKSQPGAARLNIRQAIAYGPDLMTAVIQLHRDLGMPSITMRRRSVADSSR